MNVTELDKKFHAEITQVGGVAAAWADADTTGKTQLTNSAERWTNWGFVIIEVSSDRGAVI
jgi:hypothetical protein